MRTSAAAASPGIRRSGAATSSLGPGRVPPGRLWSAGMAEAVKIVVLDGDQTGQELLDQAVRLLDPRCSASNSSSAVRSFARAPPRHREPGRDRGRPGDARGWLGSQGGHDHPRGCDDVGSPNRILREEVDGKVIVRTGRRLPGVQPIAGVHYPISVVRMAVDDAYGAKQWREGDAGAPSEIAYRTEKITRSTCRAVAEYAFRTAEKMNARVYGGPKWTVSPVYEGMLKEELDEAAARHPDIAYEPVLIDATYAGPAVRRHRCAAGDPGAEPRRRLSLGPRAADVRVDRRCRVRPAGLQRRLRDHGGDGRGAARHGAGARRARTSPIRWP